MSDDLYQDLLKTLDSDEELKIKPSVTKAGYRKYEIENKKLDQETYAREDVESLLGFATSIIASLALNTSITASIALADPKTMLTKLEKYKDLSRNMAGKMTDAAEDLGKNLSELVSIGVKNILDNEDERPDIGDTVNLNSIVATVVTCYMLGRNAKFFAETLGVDDLSTDDKIEFLTTAVRQAYANKGLVLGGAADAVEAMIQQLLEDEVVQRIERGEASFKELKELLENHVNGQEKTDE